MTKVEFINAVAKKSGLTKKTTTEALDAMLEVFSETMKEHDSITFTGVCSIGVKTVAPKKVINPQTKQPMMTNESKSLYIKTGKVLKKELNS